MDASRKTAFIVNPAAASGATGREWPRIQAQARDRLGSFKAHLTAGQGDAVHLTRRAILEGADLVVCVGGDGTLNEVVNGFMEEDGPIQPQPLLGYIPRGTGCDFVKTIPIPKELNKALDTIVGLYTRSIDLGRISYLDHQGRPSCRYFHNITSFGVGGEVAGRLNRATKILGGSISFVWALLASIFLYDKKRIRLKVDDVFDQEGTIWNVFVANGQYHGGGMEVAPGAAIDDGLIQVTVIGNLTRGEVFWHFPKLYKGRVYQVAKVSRHTGRRVEASSDRQVLFEADGEHLGQLPIVIEIVPGALRLIIAE
ncbi:MAG: diacylglycerol kinase family lipid kinase [Deltaproteobacteria bacterium]|nr:diacylglycerol kinase family lipid kinase [Deltaproteobacteria bacterium]MBW2308006.1 diacylglycerol kinase family lipid kinase [Deltaproteobacteria bacterium]